MSTIKFGICDETFKTAHYFFRLFAEYIVLSSLAFFGFSYKFVVLLQFSFVLFYSRFVLDYDKCNIYLGRDYYH
jgi:hypothetical protein